MKNIKNVLNILIFISILLPWSSYSQDNNISINAHNNSNTCSFSEPEPDPHLGIIFYSGTYGDSIAHIIWDELFYAGKPVNKVVLQRSLDGVIFSDIAQTNTSALFDIHVNNYPEEIDYFETILYSTEHGNGRFIFNDVEDKSFFKGNDVFYRLLMITFDGFYLYSGIISKEGVPFEVTEFGLSSKGGGAPKPPSGGPAKPPCPSVSSPPSGYVATSQTQTLYGTCCYYTQVLYQSNSPVLSPCGGSSYSWCCNNVPGASGCPSGWTSDPCCVHTCTQYYSCACTPWTYCCSSSQVTQWVVTQSFTYSPFTLNVSVVNETCAGMADGSAALTITGGTPPLTISWSNGQSGLNINNLVAGVYTVTVTDAGNCSGTATANVGSNPPPAVAISTVNVSCNGLSDGQATVSVTGGTPSYTYTWGPTGTAGNVPVATSLVAGTYSLTVSDVNGCQVVNPVVITEPPLLTNTFTTVDLLCFGDSDGSINITPAGGTPGYTYNWMPNVSNSASATNLVAGNYNVTITDANGCTDLANITINQPPQLVITTTGNFNACIGESVTFGATASGGVAPYVLTWDNGLGAGTSFNITAAATTTYNIVLTDTNNCMFGPVPLTISVYPPLSLNVVATPSTICSGESTILTATGLGGNGGPYVYTWDNGITVNGGVVSVSPLTTTTYSVTVTDNCTTPTETASTVVTVFPSPTASFTADIFSGCQPLTVNFSDLSIPNIQSWSWDFGDPASGSGNISNQQNPTHVFTESGTFSVTLSATTPDGCKHTYTYNNMIIVYPKPVASFVANPSPGSTLNSTITFIDQSLHASYWSWNFGESSSLNNTSTLPSPMHTYLSAGIYVVTLVVTSNYGCVDSTLTNMTILQDFMFWAPNAFTPNGNGINDLWRPYGVGIDPNNYELYIYDRWGKEVFATRDVNHGWDGAINGTMVQQGVYSWLVRVKELNGKKHLFNGHITLFR